MHLSTSLTQFVGKTTLVLKKNAPTILTGLGIVAGVAATGIAIYSTLHCESILEEHEENMKKIEKAKYVVENDPDFEGRYSDEDVTKDRRAATMRAIFQFGKLYTPTILLTAASITCVLAGHRMLSKRNAATIAAFTALSSKFGDYRNSVRERLGDEVEHDIYQRIVEEAELDDDGEPNGDIHKKQNKTNIDMSTDRFFDEFSAFWDAYNYDMNVAHLRAVSKMAQDRLVASGYLFVNDVYDMLGIQRTPAGQVLGWLRDKDHPDTVVDFGVYLDPTVIDDPWDYVAAQPWDGSTGILLTFSGTEIIYDKI